VELRGVVLGDRYLLQRRIAEGGMGQVWRAEDRVLGRAVAVKLLRPEYAEDPETLERFRAEARHAGALSHPHIAQVYDYGPLPGVAGTGHRGNGRGPAREPYLVMEYVNGPSLAEVIDREPLSVDFTCDVIAQAAAGLDAAHRVGLVHRDVKPGNLLLSGDGRVKVTDFGIAHVAGSAPITAPGIVMGTALYMAPERIVGGPGTPASDLYSLGIVMWECLVGRPPFRGTSADVMAAHLHQALPRLPAWVPAPTCELVARLTAKDPKYRLSDAGLLAVRARRLELAGAGLRAPGRPRAGSTRVSAGADPVPVSPVGGYLGAPVPAALAAGRPAADDRWPDLVAMLAPAPRPAPSAEGHRPRAGDGAAVNGNPAIHRGPASAAGRPDMLQAVPQDAVARPVQQRGQRPRAAVIIAATVAGMAVGGLVASGTLGSLARQAGSMAIASSTSSAGARVRVPAFHGQRYTEVSDWLRAHGLTPVIARAGHTGLPAGAVVSVEPGGPVPAGSRVTVTIAAASSRRRGPA
jgi:hypothetical protein